MAQCHAFPLKADKDAAPGSTVMQLDRQRVAGSNMLGRIFDRLARGDA